MTAYTHRILTAILASLTGVTALLVATDPSGLGVETQVWAWIALALSVLTIVVTAARQAADPKAGGPAS